ncbi:MAG: thioredoxin [bacterium]|nr:thioredoxin [bacterium]
MTVIHINDNNFDSEVINSNIPVLVDFWAPWCMPCKMLEPVFEELAKEYKDKVKFVKINTDDNIETATKFYITGIPTLLLFINGKVVDSIVGFVSKSELKNFIESNLNKSK